MRRLSPPQTTARSRSPRLRTPAAAAAAGSACALPPACDGSAASAPSRAPRPGWTQFQPRPGPGDPDRGRRPQSSRWAAPVKHAGDLPGPPPTGEIPAGAAELRLAQTSKEASLLTWRRRHLAPTSKAASLLTCANQQGGVQDDEARRRTEATQGGAATHSLLVATPPC